MDKKEIERIIVQNSGILTTEEGLLLFELAQNCNGDIVEIGSYLGGSTIILAKGLKNPWKVYAIDPHDIEERYKTKFIGKEKIPKNTFNIFKKNIKREKVGKKIIPIKNISENVIKNWNKPINFLWIDGDHKYEAVKRDFLLWEPFLIKGGIIAIHDSNYDWDFEKKLLPAFGIPHTYYDGPEKVVQDYIKNSNRFKIIKIVDTITCAVKIKKHNRIIEKALKLFWRK